MQCGIGILAAVGLTEIVEPEFTVAVIPKLLQTGNVGIVWAVELTFYSLILNEVDY